MKHRVCLRIAYEIEVITTDRQDAGTQHNAWLVLEGSERSSQEFVLQNSSRYKILRRSVTEESSSQRHQWTK